MNLGFWSKNGRFVTHICFSKKSLLKPYFIVFFGCAFFGPRCQKRKFETHQKRKKLLITGKLFFWHFCVFCGCFFFSCFFVVFECLPLFLLSLFLASPFFYFPFSVSLSLSLLFLSFFLPSCLSFLLSFGSCFVIFLSFSFFFAFVSWKEQHQIIQLQFFLHQSFLFFVVSCLVFLSNPFFSSLRFPDFKLCFLFNINGFGFKTNNLTTKQTFLVKRGVATKRFFYEPVFCKMSKVIVFFGLCFFWQFLFDFKKHYKIGISAHCLKAKNCQKMAIVNGYQLGHLNGY